jgi:hypothetical protein
MFNTKTIVAAAVASTLALTAVVSESAGSVASSQPARLTFNRAVALPGVTLAAGSYVFEIVSDVGHLDVVRVRNGVTNRSEFMGFTHRVPRPGRLRGLSAVTLGEAPRNAPAPVKVWYPADGDGRQFIY